MQILSWTSIITMGLFLATRVYSDLLPGQTCTSALAGGALLDTLCTVGENDPFYQVQSNACDAHCRCTHNTTWGQCETRPATAPPLPILEGYGMWCRCYTDPNSRPCLPNINPVACVVQNAFANILCSAPAAALGVCNADCYCTHGNARGQCTQSNGVTMCACFD